jgi:O-antigen/teichoic acid export membrane protein
MGTDGGPRRRGLGGRLMHSAKWAVVGHFAVMAFAFLIQMWVARLVVREEFGTFLLITSLVVVHTILASFGLPQTALRLVRANITSGQNEAARACMRTALLASGLTTLLSCTLYAVLVLGFSERLFSTDLAPYWYWGVAQIALSSLRLLTAQIFRGFEDFRWSAFMGDQQGGMLHQGLTLVGLGLIGWRGNAGLHAVFLLTTLAAVVPLLVGLPRLLKLHRGLRGGGSAPAPSGESIGVRWLVRQSAPIVVANLAMVGLKHFDIIVVGALLPGEQLALYGAAKKLMTLVATPLLVGNMAMSSFIPELLAQGRKQKLESLLRGTATLASIPTLLMIAVIVAAPGFLLATCFGEEYRAGALALLILVPGYLFSSSAGSCSNTLIMSGHQKLSMLNSLGSVAIYMVLAPSLSIWFGIGGAASALAISQMVKNVHGLLLVKRKVGVWSVVSFSPRFMREVLDVALRNLDALRPRRARKAEEPLP